MRQALIILIFLFGICSCKSNLIIQDIKTENIPNSDKLTRVDSSLIKLVQPYKDNLAAEMQEVIGTSTDDLVKERPESKLTNYLGDLLLEEGRSFAETLPKKPLPQLAYLNYGGLRTTLPRGEITVGKIFELMPFENEMVLLKLRGEDLHTFAEKLAAQGGDCVSGLKLTISDGKIADFEVAGQPFNRAAEYWLVTNDYVANGGDDMTMFTNRTAYIATGIKLRDCIIGYMRKEYKSGKKISPELDGRISIE